MTNAKSYTLELRGSLGVRDAAGIATSLLAAIEAHPAVVIAAEGLTEIDVSILQVLVAATKTASATGRSLALKAAPAGVFRQTLIKAGFISAGGAPLTAEGPFWAGSAGRSKGRAA